MPDKVAPAEKQVFRTVKSDSVSDTVKLKKELGLWDGVAIIVGIIVGAGIFVAPKGVLMNSNSVGQALLIWIFSGLLSLIGALCYAELGTMIPKSGGDYAYISDAFGPFPAFLYLWVAFFILVPTGNAITALTFAEYILQPVWPGCVPPYEAVRLLAAVITCILTVINCYNVKWATRVQDIFTATKIFALVIIIVAGFWWLCMGHTENFHAPMAGTNTQPGYIALAIYSGLFSYSGWNYLNFVTEELQEPYKNLPKAICISLPLVTIIYVLVNVAYFAVLKQDEILSSNAVAVCIITLALLSIEDVYVLINYVSFVEALFTTLSVSGLLWLRYKNPDRERPIKVSIVLPIIFFIICAFLVTVPCYVSPWEVGVGVIIILSGIPVYFIFIHWKKKPKWIVRSSHNLNMVCVKLFMCMQEEKSD
ncbi:large neutral amino acids transporter small subunit 1-like isoform X4 [Lasioglossum baleicum]|uniref:large neutral amino acids transporter small subunit 1-like isoform X4 n=1 Tax=Lasioglossum baleicum TaxID=434251 RepID=UPI003FCDBA2D